MSVARARSGAQFAGSVVLAYAVDEVTALAIDFALDQAVHVGLEAREALVEVACEAQVVDDGLLKRSPGISSGMPGGYGVSRIAVMRPSSSSIATRSISRCAILANASDGFIAGIMSDRYISVVRRATS